MRIAAPGNVVEVSRDGELSPYDPAYTYQLKSRIQRDHGVDLSDITPVLDPKDWRAEDDITDQSLYTGIGLDARAVLFFMDKDPILPDELLGSPFDDARGEHAIWMQVDSGLWVGITRLDLVENSNLIG